MNLLIRKNFHSKGGGGGGGGGGSKDRGLCKVSGGRNRKGVHSKRSRETGGYSMMEEHHSYRTHIFLSPTNVGQENEETSPASRPSYAFIKWAINGIKRKSSGAGNQLGISLNPQEATSSQVSFDHTAGRPGSHIASGSGVESICNAEPITFANIDRDCFIIPIATANRFLPEGVHITSHKTNVLNILEVEDPNLCVLIHLMGNFEPIDPIMESPMAIPSHKQRATACDLMNDISAGKCVKEGILLSTIEKNTEFPFITYYLINNSQNNPVDVFHSVRATSLRKFDPAHIRYTADHTFDLFNEVAIIARPPLQPSSRRPHSPSTGYIVTVYKVFEGDDNKRFEQNWLYWTGARMMYRYLPKSAGLRRITLHKSLSRGDKLYLLMCECANLLDDLSAAAKLLPALRARLCGYTALYRVADLI